MLELVNVSKYYTETEEGQYDYVLREIDWQVEEGQRIAIMGPSGSGKSTLMNLIGGLDRASDGKVILNQNTLSDLDEKELARIRNRDIGFVFQLHYLLPQCTVLENTLLPTLAGNGTQSDDKRDRAISLLDQVGLGQRIHHFPAQLSGGERQRVAVVRALINRPKLLLADEPTGSLDARNSDIMAELLLEMNRHEGVTLLVATHARPLAEKMDHLYLLENGQLNRQS